MLVSEIAQLAIGAISATVFVLCLIVHATTDETSWIKPTSALSVEDAEEVERAGGMLMEQKGKTVAVYPKKLAGTVRSYSVDEVRKHHTREDLWIIVRNRVYDITKFVDKHPGGWLPLRHLAGKDATDAMEAYHPAKVFTQMLPAYFIGTCCVTVQPWVEDFRKLRSELLREGLYETNMGFYQFCAIWHMAKLFLALSLLFPAVHAALNLAPYAAAVLSAILMGLYLQQMAFIGHDSGHTAVSHDRWKDGYLAAIMLQPMMGLSLGWWKRNHNTHHIISNCIEHDPDIQHWPVFCVSDTIFPHLRTVSMFAEKMFSQPGGIWSTYYRKYIGVLDSVATVLLSFQHWLFYPIMAVARFNLYAQCWRHLVIEKDVKVDRVLEAVTLSIFTVWFLALCLYGVPDGASVMYLLLSHAVAGILHVQICQNHFSMTTFEDSPYTCTWDATKHDDWWVTQLHSTLNVSCPRWLDWFHGGLQFQINHHLFPRVPRHNLRHITQRIKQVCKRHSFYFYAPTMLQANLDLIETMYTTALHVQSNATGKVSARNHYDNFILDGLFARG